jgi:hypothetical protein
MPREPDRNGATGGEAAAEAAGEGRAPTEESAEEAGAEARTASSSAGAGLLAASQPGWSDIISAGMSLLQRLSAPAGSGRDRGGLPASLVARDEATGQPYLKLPIPNPDVVQKIVDLLGALTGGK